MNSIVNQTYFDLENIIVNDGPTDESLVISEKYRKIDDRIGILHLLCY